MCCHLRQNNAYFLQLRTKVTVLIQTLAHSEYTLGTDRTSWRVLALDMWDSFASAAARHIRKLTEGWPGRLTRKPRTAGDSRSVERWPSRQNESRSALNSRAPFGYPERGFPWFSSVVRQMPGYSMQSRGKARTPLPQARQLHLSVWQTSHNTSMWQSQSGLGNQTANQPTKVY